MRRMSRPAQQWWVFPWSLGISRLGVDSTSGPRLTVDAPLCLMRWITYGEAFFSDPAQAHNRGRSGSGSTRTVESRGRPHVISISNSTSNPSNETDMDTPMPMKRISGGMFQFPNAAHIPSSSSREGDTKELREFWRVYAYAVGRRGGWRVWERFE